MQVIGGNIVTAEAAEALVEAGADGVKVGIGPGSICTTRIVAGVGVPQISAVAEVAAALQKNGVPLIADGGIRYSGDIAKAIVAGAYSVMIGGLFAGTEESPGEVELYQGRSYKSYRGMGSLGAMGKRTDRRIAISRTRPRNSKNSCPRASRAACRTRAAWSRSCTSWSAACAPRWAIRAARRSTRCARKPKFVQITGAGMRESHVHDVTITKEAPNYRKN